MGGLWGAYAKKLCKIWKKKDEKGPNFEQKRPQNKEFTNISQIKIHDKNC